MKQIGGGKDYVLTWGGLMVTLSTLSNLSSDGQLNHQKSAEVIVRVGLEQLGRTEQLRENSPWHAYVYDNHRKQMTSLERK